MNSTENKTLAQRLYDADSACSEIEDALDDLWPIESERLTVGNLEIAEIAADYQTERLCGEIRASWAERDAALKQLNDLQELWKVVMAEIHQETEKALGRDLFYSPIECVRKLAEAYNALRDGKS